MWVSKGQTDWVGICGEERGYWEMGGELGMKIEEWF